VRTISTCKRRLLIETLTYCGSTTAFLGIVGMEEAIQRGIEHQARKLLRKEEILKEKISKKTPT